MAPGVELSDLNWMALLAGFATSIALGFIWYAPQVPTGRIWMREMKIPAGSKPTSAQMMKGIGLMLVGTFLFMFVLMHVFIAFRDAYTLDDPAWTDIKIVDGLMGGFFTWLGFYLPVGLSSVGWEMKSWSLFFVNTSYYLVTLLLVGLIFASMM